MGAEGLWGTRAPGSPDAGARGGGTLSEKSSKLEDYTRSAGRVTSLKHESELRGASSQAGGRASEAGRGSRGTGQLRLSGSAQGPQPPRSCRQGSTARPAGTTFPSTARPGAGTTFPSSARASLPRPASAGGYVCERGQATSAPSVQPDFSC